MFLIVIYFTETKLAGIISSELYKNEQVDVFMGIVRCRLFHSDGFKTCHGDAGRCPALADGTLSGFSD